jgi:hypothetical protein
MSHLVVAGKSLLPRVGLGAADDLASVDGVLRVNLGVSLEVLLSGEGLVTLRAVVDPLHLFSSAVSLHVIACKRLEKPYQILYRCRSLFFYKLRR